MSLKLETCTVSDFKIAPQLNLGNTQIFFSEKITRSILGIDILRFLINDGEQILEKIRDFKKKRQIEYITPSDIFSIDLMDHVNFALNEKNTN